MYEYEYVFHRFANVGQFGRMYEKFMRESADWQDRWDLIIRTVADILEHKAFQNVDLTMFDLVIEYGGENSHYCVNQVGKRKRIQFLVAEDHSDADMQFVIWHEFGHVKDIIEKKLRFRKEKGSWVIVFDGMKIHAGVMVALQMAKMHLYKKQKIYARLEHELSANTFAAQNTTRPDLMTMRISYKAGKENA